MTSLARYEIESTVRHPFPIALALLLVCAALAGGMAPASAGARATAVPGPPAESAAPELTLAAVGDMMLARSIGAALRRAPDASPFDGVAQTLRAADLTVGNLECAVGSAGTPARKAYTFLAPPAAAAALADAGFDLVSLANNHSLDFGTDALSETARLLDQAGILHPGAGADEAAAHRPARLTAGGLRLAFLAYVNVPVERGGFSTASWRARGDRAGVAWAEPQRIADDVAAARADADLVIVLLHSGYEGQQTTNAAQRASAHAAIDAGAALVIGAHPHVLQGAERYHGGLIAYSLGNFVFDGLYKRSETAILKVTLSRDGVRSFEWLPVALRDGRPQLASGAQASAILKRIARLSAIENRRTP